jgi:hypothetical protein
MNFGVKELREREKTKIFGKDLVVFQVLPYGNPFQKKTFECSSLKFNNPITSFLS